MSPELERILTALYERDTCDQADRERWNATLEELLEEAPREFPKVSRDQFLQAIASRYPTFRRAQRRPPTMPPRA
jgi:hypothetical protein